MTTFAGSRKSSPVARCLLSNAVMLCEIPAQGYADLASNSRKLDCLMGHLLVIEAGQVRICPIL
jgi:hypothetical protein